MPDGFDERVYSRVMIEGALGKRLCFYLVLTFAISWPAWWILAAVVRPTVGVFAHPWSLVLFLLGGFGPTIAALVAVASTPERAAFGEYKSRLFRWRVNPLWWVAALAIPPGMAWTIERIDLASAGAAASADPLQPISRLVFLFPLMIIGGGLEELGWRGVAQTELERRFGRLTATTLVGAFWASWHLPLFFIPGVAQYSLNFGLFALQIMGTSFVTAWLYANTRSILLCVLFHAAGNTAGTMGLSASNVPATAALFGCAVRLALGLALVGSLSYQGVPRRPR